MPDDLLTYYERELTFLRQLGADFATKYPKIASRLLLEADKCEDPHVERLLQGVAFLAARVHHKIDDEFPELTESLLNVLYPHFLAPIPSMAIVQFVPASGQGKVTTPFRIPRGSTVFSQPVGGTPCRFRTAYPVALWPVEVVSAQLDSADRLGASAKAAAVIRIGLRCVGGTTFPELTPDALRFFLHGETTLTHALYELLFNACVEVQFRTPRGARGPAPVVLPPQALRPVGFAPDEGMLPYPARSFLGYRLLQEYFALPEKFHFVDVTGFERAAAAGFGSDLELMIFLDRMPRLEQAITPSAFRLACSPVVNLFEQVAEPIRLSQAQTEYRVVADVRRQDTTEIYTVDSVVSSSPNSSETTEFHPFYSFKHAIDRDRDRAFWYAARRPSPRKGDTGTEVYLTLVDLNFQPTVPAVDTLLINATSTNRDLPGKLPFGGDRGDFELEGAAPLARIRCLTKPTATLRPPLRRGAQWRLISHLSLNYLSIAEGGREALREILTLYDISDSAVLRQQIAGITDVKSRRIVARPASMPWNGFCRGVEVTVTFDENKYVGSGVFLFAAVLEKFLGLYVSLNSFTQLIARTEQRREPLKRWPPRAGEQILL